MAYLDIADMAVDPDLNRRIKACCAQENFDPPQVSTISLYWRLAARKEWSAAWEYARASGAQTLGAKANVITDQMILDGVRAEQTHSALAIAS